jgi:hypothetical protein
VDEPMIERWLRVPANQRELAALNGRGCPDWIRAETQLHIARLSHLSEATFGAFIQLFGLPARRCLLPSH